ncbi:MAG: hypothetical protein AB3N63_00485 [Puniceicoccaceae bacterium]
MSRIIAIISTVLCACTCMADWMAEVVTDPLQEPYRYTGRLTSSRWVGSGVVVGSERTIVTAAHVVFDESTLQWLNSINWRQRNEGSATIVRGIRYLSDYASRVEAYGGESLDAFGADMAVLYAFEPLSDEGYGEPLSDPDSALASSKQKMVTGFPSGNYGQGHVDAEKMHKTGPFPSAFTHLYDQYHKLEGASHGRGGSGGGTWVQEPGGWKYAAVYIAGQRKDNWNPINSMGVVALSGVKRDLLDEVLDELSTYIPPQITLEPPALVQGDLDDDIFITVGYNTTDPITEVVLEYWDTELPEEGFRPWWPEPGNLQFDDTHAVLTIPSHTYSLHDKILRVLVRNNWGGSYSREFRFKYDLPSLPEFTTQPESQVLANNASAILEARINLPATATLHWETKPYGSSEFQYFRDADIPYSRLVIEAEKGFYNGDQFRLVAFDGIRTIYSDTATLTWTDVGLQEALVISEPPQFIHYGDSCYVEVGIKGTAAYGFTWSFINKQGNFVPAPPEVSVIRGPYGHQSILRIRNFSQYLNGSRIIAKASVTYYAQVPGGKERTNESIIFFEWNLKASGPSHHTSDYQVSYDEQLHQVSAKLDNFDVNSSDITWQASTDGGVRWHVLQSEADGELLLPLDENLEQGTTLRAVIKQGETTIHTYRIPVNVGSSRFISKDMAETHFPVYWMSGMALSPDSNTLAYCQNDGDRPVRIVERVGDSWKEKAVIPLEGISHNRINEILFISNTRILVSLPFSEVSDTPNSGRIVEIIKQPDGQWVPQEPITYPAPKSGDYFSRAVDYDNGYLIATIEDREVPFRILRKVDDEWIFCTLEGVPAYAQSSLGFVNRVAISGDSAVVRGRYQCMYFKRSGENTWVFKDSLNLFEQHAPIYIEPNGNLIIHDQSRMSQLGIFEEWKLNEYGILVKVPSEEVTFGAPENVYHCSAIDSYKGLHGLVNQFSSFQTNRQSAFLFKNDPTSGKRFVASIRTRPPYQIKLISIAEEHIALQLDNLQAGPEDNAWWQVWLIPIDQIEFKPLVNPDWPVNLAASLTRTGQSIPAAKLRFRESYNPPAPITIQSSPNGIHWSQLAEEDFVRTVLDPDIDGDNKTALIEVSIPLQPEDETLLLRAVEE